MRVFASAKGITDVRFRHVDNAANRDNMGIEDLINLALLALVIGTMVKACRKLRHAETPAANAHIASSKTASRHGVNFKSSLCCSTMARQKKPTSICGRADSERLNLHTGLMFI